MLAFDTSTEQLSIGVQGPGPAWHLALPGGAAASATLLPQIQGLMARAGMALADLDFIAFGRGPGAFTGLRTACAVAQGLGWGLGKPVLPIDSLMIVAEDARAQAAALHPGTGVAAFDVGVVADARMDEVYAGRYRWAMGRWQVPELPQVPQGLQAPGLYSLPSLAAAWAGVAFDAVAGSALDAFGPHLRLPTGGLRMPKESDRAAALLRLAVWSARAGAAVDAAEALPVYLRDKVAQTPAERAAVAAAKDLAAAQAARAAAERAG